jgi:hypothetical protein
MRFVSGCRDCDRLTGLALRDTLLYKVWITGYREGEWKLNGNFSKAASAFCC